MPTINQLPAIDVISSGDQLPVYAPNLGDVRRMSISTLSQYIEDNVIVPNNAANVTYDPAGTGAVSRSVQAKLRDVVSVKDFGAVGDGVANDKAAFAAAFAASNSVQLVAGETYWLGNVTSNAAVFSFTGSNKIIDFNGAKVTVTTSGGNYNAPLFELNNLDGFTLLNPVIEDLGFDQTQTWKGITVVNFAPTTGKVRNVRIIGAKYTSVVSAFSDTSATYDAENIWFEGDIYNCYYGINLANNGHKLTADYRTYNAVRSYFCYGVRNHEINCVSDTHAAIGNADFLIKCQEAAHPTKSIRARFVSVNSQATTNPQLVFESQNDSGNASIEDCWIHYDDTQSGSIADSIAFRHYSNSGVLQATDPNTKARINVVGRARGTVTYSSVPTSAQDQNLDGCLGVMPAFCSILGSPVLNATGDGTVVDLVFDTEFFDTASNYNNSTGVFTAPRDGVYSFSAQSLLIDKGSAHTRVDLRLVTTPKTFNRTETNSGNPPYPEDTVQINVPAVYLKKNETAKIQVAAYNGTKVIDIFGDSIAYTYFSGTLLRGGPKST